MPEEPAKKEKDEQGQRCPDCRTPMVERGSVAGRLGIGMTNFTSTLYQCPRCKTVTLAEPG
jgi:hypothetical protein